MSPVPVCLGVRHSSPGLSLGRRTSFFYLSYSRWCGICSLSSFLEKFASCLSWWQPVFYQLSTAWRGGHPSVCLTGIASSSHGACHLHLICYGVYWWHGVQLDAVLSQASGSFGVCGSHTVLVYSTRGLTRVKYACFLMATEPILRFFRRKLRVLLDFAHVWLMRMSHFRSSVMVNPRYLTVVTLASLWSFSLYSVCRGFLLPVTVMTLQLVAWNFIFQSTSQNPMVVRPSCTFSSSWGFTMTRYAMVSSANSLTTEFRTSDRSLI